MLFAPQEHAQGLLEYALILVIVAVLVIAVVYIFGGGVGRMFSNVTETI